MQNNLCLPNEIFFLSFHRGILTALLNAEPNSLGQNLWVKFFKAKLGKVGKLFTPVRYLSFGKLSAVAIKCLKTLLNIIIGKMVFWNRVLISIKYGVHPQILFYAVISLDVLTICSYITCMNFEWDDDKRQINVKKHGIDFINVSKLFESYTLTIKDDRYDYGEERFVTFGILEGRVVAVVHTENEDSIRIISIRKATKYEEKKYFSKFSD